MTELYVGIAALMLPPILIGALLLRRNRPVFVLLLALVGVGTGYLVTTGAAQDIGRSLMGTVQPAAVPVKQTK